MAQLSKALDSPYPKPIGPHLSLVAPAAVPDNEIAPGVTLEDGALKIEHENGDITVDLEPNLQDASDEANGFSRNLAIGMGGDDLSTIANDLLEGIQRDDDSRKEWLETRAMGISLLGLKLEKPKAEASTSASMEGMSTVRHPILLNATTQFQATARGELLPASGPVKVRNDAPTPPVSQQQGATPDQADRMQNKDDLATALEKDLNHYLTAVATEYVPDTDRMLFYIGFGGDGFKKVYNCPLRSRPVSESVDAEDLIVSNAATDLQNCARITHRIRMRKSVLRRMQILGVYRDIDLQPPQQPTQTPVDRKKEEIAGIRTVDQRPEDRDYEIYECYCELDLDQFAPKQFKNKGLPLPYRVTIVKESRQILDIRRNWKEDDDQALAQRFFVQFPFIRGLGFYGLGYIHLLGNTANTLTAAWRMMLDAGMFANFPGFLFAKGAGRQNTNQFRIPPGGGMGIDVGAQQSIKDAIMPLPYKEVGPSFVNFITHVEELGDKLAATANANVGEGKQEAPVGTTLALIEQATKVLDSAHKRLHAAQAEEFKLLKARFEEDPEALWRHNKKTTIQWRKDQFMAALESHELVPVADPNNPTSLHRIAKAMAIKQLAQGNPLYDQKAVDLRIMRIADIDPEGLFAAQPPPPPPDPRLIAIQQKAQTESQKRQIDQIGMQIKAAQAQASLLDKQQDRASRERLAQMKLQIEQLRLQQEALIHGHELMRGDHQAAQDMQIDQTQRLHDLHMDRVERGQDLQQSAIAAAHEMYGGRIKSEHDLEMQRERHRFDMDRAKEKHDLDMQHMQELHQERLAAARAMAKAKPKKERTNV